MSYKTIKVREATYEKIAKLGTVADSFDSVLDRLVTSRANKGERTE